MRIAIAGVSHETNTYCQGLTAAADFHQLRGKRLLATAGHESDVGGAVAACLAIGAQPVPILYANAQPSGMIERSAYEGFKREILEGIAEAMPLDGVVLLLHGAGVVEGIDDLEGDLAAAVRELVGPGLPMAASFDLHGNITQHMADQLNGVFACHQYPHIDLHTRATEAVELVAAMVKDGFGTTCRVISLPLLLPTTTTFEGVGQLMLEEVLRAEADSGVIDISWFHGFPYTDIPHIGSYLVMTRRVDQSNADQWLITIADRLWQMREDFRPASLNADEAVAAAVAQDAYPVVINETSDNCGGGSPGDGTHLLRAMLDAGLGGDGCFGFVVDAQTAAQAHRAGVGHDIDVQLGGRTDDLHGEPLVASAYVKALHDGRLVMQHMYKGSPLNVGPLARLVIQGMDVVVGSRRSQTFDREPFLAVGIDVMRYKYVALKSSNHFRAGFQHLAGAIVTADPPGLTTHHIEVFPRQRTDRRLWPLDDRTEFSAATALDVTL